MEDKHSFISEFNPFLVAQALQGITDALFALWDDEPGPKQGPERERWEENLYGLAYAARVLARQLSLYLQRIDEQGYRIPHRPPETPRVEETPAVYRVK